MVNGNVAVMGGKRNEGNLGHHKSWPENLIGLGIGQAGVDYRPRTLARMPPDLRPAPQSPLLAGYDREGPEWRDGLGIGTGIGAG